MKGRVKLNDPDIPSERDSSRSLPSRHEMAHPCRSTTHDHNHCTNLSLSHDNHPNQKPTTIHENAQNIPKNQTSPTFKRTKPNQNKYIYVYQKPTTTKQQRREYYQIKNNIKTKLRISPKDSEWRRARAASVPCASFPAESTHSQGLPTDVQRGKLSNPLCIKRRVGVYPRT